MLARFRGRARSRIGGKIPICKMTWGRRKIRLLRIWQVDHISNASKLSEKTTEIFSRFPIRSRSWLADSSFPTGPPGILSGRGSQTQELGHIDPRGNIQGEMGSEISQVGENVLSKHSCGQIACSLGRTNSMFATDLREAGAYANVVGNEPPEMADRARVALAANHGVRECR